MLHVVIRPLTAVLFGAVAGVLCLLLGYPLRSTVVLDMDRDPPSFLAGVHAAEREGARTFAWTSSRVTLRLAGLDRRVDWTCAIHVRGARDASQPMPSLMMAFDGVGSTTAALTNEFQEVSLVVPARPDRSGLVITADVTPTFRPGGSDPRELGAQIDWMRCTPAGPVRPPEGAMRAAAVGGAAMALAAVVAGATTVLLVPTVLAVSAGQAWLLVTGAGVFGSYPALLTTIVCWGAALVALMAWAPVLVRRQRLSGWTLAAVTVSIVLASLKLAALEHPAKLLIDALFQAHRLEWVVAGRYFFTQPMPSGVQFPYAIGLYGTAAPLASIITDHVLLLRLVVIVAEAAAGLCLYAVLARGFQDRAAGVLAVVLFHLMPASHFVVGNANLTNAFAQAIGACVLCGLALIPAPARSREFLAAATGLTALTALAFLSHVGTIVVVAATLGMMVVMCLLARRTDLTRLAAFTVVMTLVAALLAVGLYYRHFTDVYREAYARVRAPAAADVVSAPAGSEALDAPAMLTRPLAWHERVSASWSQTLLDVGWPMLLLAVAGGLLGLRGRRDRTAVLLVAWAAAWILLIAGSTIGRVDIQFQRYAVEFVARVNLAAGPLLAGLAGLGATSLWRRAVATRVVAVVLVAAGLWAGWASLGRWLVS